MNHLVPFDPYLILALVASNTAGTNDEQLRMIFEDLQQQLELASETNVLGSDAPQLEKLWCTELISESMTIRALAKSSQLSSEGKTFEAIEVLENVRSFTKSPWTTEVLNNLAVLHVEIGNMSEAGNLIRRASDLAPKDILIKGNLNYLLTTEKSQRDNEKSAEHSKIMPINIVTSDHQNYNGSSEGEFELKKLDEEDDSYFSLKQLQSPGPYPPGIDARKREDYLNDDEFVSTFEMSREEFLKIPKWRQVQLKKLAKLF